MLTFKQFVTELASEARERKLRGMIRTFRNEPDANKSNRQWKQIEKEVFGVDYHD